jgi:hypothetical protein
MYKSRMSAIVWIYTTDGFVVGADGRRKDLSGQAMSDSEQKIFFFATGNIRGAFTWNGCTEIGTVSSTFDFKAVTRDVLQSLAAEHFRDLSELITNVSLTFIDRLSGWIQVAGARAEYPDNREWASIQMYGYVEGTPGMARAVFPFENGSPGTPGLDIAPKRLDGTLVVSSGNQTAYEEMVAADRMHRCTNLLDSQRLVDDYIQLCGIRPENASNNIGGHIHIAALTPKNSGWLIPPTV